MAELLLKATIYPLPQILSTQNVNKNIGGFALRLFYDVRTIQRFVNRAYRSCATSVVQRNLQLRRLRC